MKESTQSAWVRVIKKVSPITQPKITEISGLEYSFSLPGIRQVVISALEGGASSDNYCIRIPDSTNIDMIRALLFPADLIDEIENNFKEIGSISLFNPLKFNGKVGKDYEKNHLAEQDDRIQLPLEAYEETCIHGAMKPLCEICTPSMQAHRKGKKTIGKQKSINIFDLLLPILQPPLGNNFDNAIAIPKPLYGFQREGVRFLVERKSALLADDMGIGKSIQTIVALRVLFRLGKISNGIIVAPKSVLFDWEKKLWDWAPELQITLIRGTKEKRKIAWKTQAHIKIVTYDTLRQDINKMPNLKCDFVVLDEIQRIKNPATATAKATRKIISTIRWGLSGTPIENRIEEIIAIFTFLKPNLLAVEDAKFPSRVKKKITPYFLRRRLEDVIEDLQIGEKLSNEVWLDLTSSQREAYVRANEEGVVHLNSLGEKITIQHVLALITHLKLICNRDPVSGNSSKLEYLIEKITEDVDPDDKVLVFSQYPQKTLEPMIKDLEEFGAKLFSGKLSDKKRKEIIENFENDENRVLLMSVKAGGVGLTITRANHVFHFDHWWNPAIASQAEGRAHRIGQEKTVFVTTLFTRNTIEEKIHRILERKRALFDELIDDLSDSSLNSLLSEDELFGLFGLGEKTIGKSDRGLKDLDPFEFEEMMAELCRRIGYDVRETQKSRDGGVDLYVKRDTGTGIESVIIQCKHYPNGTVGVDKVRELYGVLMSKAEISRAVLITSGYFSSTAINFSNSVNLKLINGDELRGIMIKYKLKV